MRDSTQRIIAIKLASSSPENYLPIDYNYDGLKALIVQQNVILDEIGIKWDGTSGLRFSLREGWSGHHGLATQPSRPAGKKQFRRALMGFWLNKYERSA